MKKHFLKYWNIYLGYALYAVVLTFIFSQNGCASNFETLRHGNTIVNKTKIIGVPVIVIDGNKLMVGYSPGQLSCILLQKGCSKKIYNMYLDSIRIKE